MAERFAMADDEQNAPPSAFSTSTGGQPFYKWLHAPENADRAKHFNLAMRGIGHTEELAFLEPSGR
jgi:hypothetical protein